MPCGDPHNYKNINQTKISEIIDSLKSSGAKITGTNPWNVDTNNHGIKLVGNWDSQQESLSVKITDKSFLVPCKMVWEKLDSMIFKIADSDIV